jgi:hypothetical protein
MLLSFSLPESFSATVSAPSVRPPSSFFFSSVCKSKARAVVYVITKIFKKVNKIKNADFARKVMVHFQLKLAALVRVCGLKKVYSCKVITLAEI